MNGDGDRQIGSIHYIAAAAREKEVEYQKNKKNDKVKSG